MTMTVEDKVVQAKSRLCVEVGKPFYYGIVYRRPIVYDDPRVRTAAIDGFGTIYLNRQWVGQLTIDQIVFLLAHEAMHWMLKHATRRGTRDPVQWNIAGDKVINDMLVYDGVGEVIPDGVYEAGARESTADELYEAPKPPEPQEPEDMDDEDQDDQPDEDQDDQEPDDCDQPVDSCDDGDDDGDESSDQGDADEDPDEQGDEQSEDGSGGDAGEPEPDPEHTQGDDIGGAGNDLLEVPMSEEEQSQAESDLLMDVIAADKMQKMRGEGYSPGMERLVERIKTAPIPWHEVLEEYMTNMFPADITWNRPNKKYRRLGVYLPSICKDPQIGHIVIVLDTSGSVSFEEACMYIEHCNTIFEKLKPQKVTIIHCDRMIRHTETYEGDQLPITLERLYGGGGTRFEPAFRYTEEYLEQPDLLLYFTDLEGATDFEPPKFPVIWATTYETEADFGDVIEIDAA